MTLACYVWHQSDRHESFDHTRRITAGRCSTSTLMRDTRAVQREQRSTYLAMELEKATSAHDRGA